MNNKTDVFTGLGVALISAWIYFSASQLPAVESGMNAGGFPKFIAVCMGALGLLLAVVAFIKLKTEGDKPAGLTLREVLLAAAMVVSFALYLIVLRPLGYLVATPIFFIIFGLIYGEKNWKRLAIVSVGFTIAVYLLFEKLADLIFCSSFLLSSRLHLIDVVCCLEADDIEDLERSCRSTCCKSPGEIYGLRIRYAVGPESLCCTQERDEHRVENVSRLLLVKLKRNHSD